MSSHRPLPRLSGPAGCFGGGSGGCTGSALDDWLWLDRITQSGDFMRSTAALTPPPSKEEPFDTAGCAAPLDGAGDSPRPPPSSQPHPELSCRCARCCRCASAFASATRDVRGRGPRKGDTSSRVATPLRDGSRNIEPNQPLLLLLVLSSEYSDSRRCTTASSYSPPYPDEPPRDAVRADSTEDARRCCHGPAGNGRAGDVSSGIARGVLEAVSVATWRRSSGA